MKEIKTVCDICGESTTHQEYAGWVKAKERTFLGHDVCLLCYNKIFYVIAKLIQKKKI